MKPQIKNAYEYFENGFSCSQAVLASYSEEFGLDKETALRIAQPFGGGMAQMGRICGAVTGAFMVIGLKYGRTKADDIEAKNKTYECMREFMHQFQSRHHSLICRELLGFDLSSPTEHKKAEESGVFDELCPGLVQSAAEILGDLLYE